jgi:hypothetical protein
MATRDPRSLIFDVLAPGQDHGQNRSQKLNFRHSGHLGGTMAKIDPRSLTFQRARPLRGTMAEVDPRSFIFDVLDPWAKRWQKQIPEV